MLKLPFHIGDLVQQGSMRLERSTQVGKRLEDVIGDRRIFIYGAAEVGHGTCPISPPGPECRDRPLMGIRGLGQISFSTFNVRLTREVSLLSLSALRKFPIRRHKQVGQSGPFGVFQQRSQSDRPSRVGS